MSRAFGRLCILDLFDEMARAFELRKLLPRPDGSLLLLTREGARVVWRPEPQQGDLQAAGLNGGFVGERLNPESLARLAAPIALALSRRPWPLLTYRPAPEAPIELNRWFIAAHLTDFLEEERSEWDGLLLGKIEEIDERSIRLHFGRVGVEYGFELRALHDPEVDAGKGWQARAPFAWRKTGDVEPDESRRRASPELFLLYALARTFSPGQKTRASLSEHERKERVDGVATTETSGCATGLDPRDESPPARFIIPSRQRLLGTYEVFSTLLGAGPELAFLVVSPRACAKLPLSSGFTPVSHVWHRFATLPIQTPSAVFEAATLEELDFIMGMEEQVRASLGRLLADPRPRMLAVQACCVCDFVGLDLEGLVAEALGERALPVLRWTANPAQGFPLETFWRQVFGLLHPAAQRIAASVNLVGFAAKDSVNAAHLGADLAAAGIAVNTFLVPEFNHHALTTFNRASLTVVYDDRSVFDEIGTCLAELSEPPLAVVKPPFGVSASLAFLRDLAGRLGLDPEAFSGYRDSLMPSFEEQREKAAAYPIAIPVDGENYTCLCDPGELFGIPLLALLSELGFPLRVLALAPLTDDAMRAALEARRPPEGRVEIEAFATPEALLDRLARPDIALVFSEYSFDERVKERGKLSFAPRQIEMGLVGAIRTQRRLLRLAKAGTPLANLLARTVGPEDAA